MNEHALDVYDRQGRRITLTQWTALLDGGQDYRRVAVTEVGLYQVSTVWLGLDHSYFGPPPLIFETMVFAADDGVVTAFGELDVRRYPTEAAALAGHEQAVAVVRATTGMFT